MQKYVNGVKMAKKYLQLKIVLKTITVILFFFWKIFF